MPATVAIEQAQHPLCKRIPHHIHKNANRHRHRKPGVTNVNLKPPMLPDIHDGKMEQKCISRSPNLKHIGHLIMRLQLQVLTPNTGGPREKNPPSANDFSKPHTILLYSLTYDFQNFDLKNKNKIKPPTHNRRS